MANVDNILIKLNITGDYRTKEPITFTLAMSDPALNKYRTIYFPPTIRLSEKLIRKADIDVDPQIVFGSLSDYLKLMKYVEKNKNIPKISVTQAKADGIVDANIDFMRKLYFSRTDKIYIDGRAYVVSTSKYQKGSFEVDNKTFRVSFNVRVIDGSKRPGTIDFARSDCKTKAAVLNDQFQELTGMMLGLEVDDISIPNRAAPNMYSSDATGFTTGRGPQAVPATIPTTYGTNIPRSQANPFSYPVAQARPVSAPPVAAQRAVPSAPPGNFYQQPQPQPTRYSLGGGRIQKAGLGKEPDEYWLVTNNVASIIHFDRHTRRPVSMNDAALIRNMVNSGMDGGFWFIQWSPTRNRSRHYGQYHLSFIDEEEMEHEEFPRDTEIINVDEDGGNRKKRTKRRKKKRKQTRKPKRKGKRRTRRRR